MTKLIATVGLQASGKSTWASNEVKNNPEEIIIVNRDDLRASIHSGNPWGKKQEKVTVAIRDSMIRQGLNMGLDVICADTNLSPKVRDDLAQIALECNAEFVIQDFTYVPVDICVRRDAERPNPIGEDVIRQTARRYGLDR